METIVENHRQLITATEDDGVYDEDEIPGPAYRPDQTSQGHKRNGSTNNMSRSNNNSSVGSGSSSRRIFNLFSKKGQGDELQITQSAHTKEAGDGILADASALAMNPNDFANGCKLLQAAARGDIAAVRECLKRTDVNFRDYDRRTAVHVATSEGHLKLVQFLVETCHARINRSDRWGGSPLDDAHRHRHGDLTEYLRQHGAVPGSGNRVANLIKAAADGDVEEVQYCIKASVNVNCSDYDKRTPLHLAANEGHILVVKALLEAGADVNAQDRWSKGPLDDAKAPAVEQLLVKYGAKKSTQRNNSSNSTAQHLDQSHSSGQRAMDNLKVEIEDLEMVDKIGSGAFGEIYKCRWRGTFVAAKIIRSAKIRQVWTKKRLADANPDDAIDVMDRDDSDVTLASDEKDMALADFRREISVLKSLRHPNIVLMLAYSTTADFECIISELMKCSLLDVFKAHLVHGTRMSKRTQVAYATQLAQGMNYLHTCKPPIIHRDLKPANLLLDYSGNLKISDFGLSKLRPNPGKNETCVFTMTGETGSYRFMAPEVFLHQEYNETVDIYSYAMILYQLLVGVAPWALLAGLDAVRRASEEGDRPLIPRDVDIRLQNLLQDCWNEKPNTRPPFTKILDTLSSYSKDVFKQDSTEHFAVREADPQGCCSLM